jgi:imidazolonepropionase-like amidohydrolase
MTPMQAIAGATRWPARFLKKEKELGTLAPGRLADVIAVSAPLLRSAGTVRQLLSD